MIEEEYVRFETAKLLKEKGFDEICYASYEYFESGDEGDSETWKNRLENEALPSYDSYLEKLKALSYENAEVQNLLDLFIKSSENQREAIQHVINSVTELDTEELTNAEQCITDSETYLKMYEDGLESLCDKYNIEIVGEFQTSTMTDATESDAE